MNHLEFNSSTHLICLNARVFLNRNKEFRRPNDFSLSPETSLSLNFSSKLTKYLFSGSWQSFIPPKTHPKVTAPLQKMSRHCVQEFVFAHCYNASEDPTAPLQEKKEKTVQCEFTSHPSSGRLKKGAMDVITLINSRYSLKIDIYSLWKYQIYYCIHIIYE